LNLNILSPSQNVSSQLGVFFFNRPKNHLTIWMVISPKNERIMKEMCIAGLGGFLGTCGRYGIGLLMKRLIATPFPLGTFTVNIVGCLIIGLLYGWVAKTPQLPQAVSLLLITGFCGGFTTFSTFSDDWYLLWQQRQTVLAVVYPVASLVLGLAMVWAGRALMR
jgi:CrcB protein